MSSRTSPRNNSSPRDPPLRPSTASHMHPIDLGARGIADMALPPTLLQEKNNPFHIDAAQASYAVDEERREEARALRGRRRDKLLAPWEAEGRRQQQ